MFFPFGNEYILYNTLRGSIFAVDSEIKDRLEKNDLSSLSQEYIHLFESNGILVEDELNEHTVFRLMFEQSKYMLPYTTVHIATTYACNLACVYCYEGKERWNRSVWTKEVPIVL